MNADYDFVAFVNQLINRLPLYPKVSPVNSTVLGVVGNNASYRSLARVESYGWSATITTSTVAIFLV